MDKRTVRRIVATALAVILAEQVFFLICGFGLPVQFGDTFMGELKSKYAVSYTHLPMQWKLMRSKITMV